MNRLSRCTHVGDNPGYRITVDEDGHVIRHLATELQRSRQRSSSASC
jgi:hypothetical protein